jgi:hypothetical protein
METEMEEIENLAGELLEVKRFWLERYGYRSAREAGGAHDCP